VDPGKLQHSYRQDLGGPFPEVLFDLRAQVRKRVRYDNTLVSKSRFAWKTGSDGEQFAAQVNLATEPPLCSFGLTDGESLQPLLDPIQLAGSKITGLGKRSPSRDGHANDAGGP
jgi:hypothetical protein